MGVLSCPEMGTSSGRPEKETSFSCPEKVTSFGLRPAGVPLSGRPAGVPFSKRPKRVPFLGQVVFVVLLMFTGAIHAQAIEPLPFASQAQELRFQHLTASLRCPMCQNETLADSNAPIARDLRNQIFRMMQQGKSDAQIKQFLVDRYSDYVLYDPPVKPSTWLLWFGPLLILLLGGAVVVIAIRQRSRHVTAADLRPDDGDDW